MYSCCEINPILRFTTISSRQKIRLISISFCLFIIIAYYVGHKCSDPFHFTFPCLIPFIAFSVALKIHGLVVQISKYCTVGSYVSSLFISENFKQFLYLFDLNLDQYLSFLSKGATIFLNLHGIDKKFVVSLGLICSMFAKNII